MSKSIFITPHGDRIELPENVTSITIPSSFPIGNGQVIQGYIELKPEPVQFVAYKGDVTPEVIQKIKDDWKEANAKPQTKGKKKNEPRTLETNPRNTK